MRRILCVVGVVLLVATGCAASPELSGGATATDAQPAGDASIAEADPAATPIESDDDEAAAPTPALADVTLAETTIESLDRVPVLGLESESGAASLSFVVEVEGRDVVFPVFADAEGAYVIAPVVSPAPGAAVDVVARFADEDGSGPSIEVVVQTPAADPGAASRHIDALQADLDAAAGLYGTGYDELAAIELDAVTRELLPLKAFQLVIDDGTDDDLSSILGGDGNRSPEEQALIDALIGKLTTTVFAPDESAVPNESAASAPTESPAAEPAPAPEAEPTPNRDRDGAKDGPTPLGQARNSAASVPRAFRQAACIDAGISIANGAELANALNKGLSARRSVSGAVGQLASDAGLAFGVGSAVPGPVGVASGVVSIGIGSVLTRNVLDAAMYPTAVGEISADLSATEFNADYEMPGTISNVTVSATSTGGGAVGDITGLSGGLVTLGGDWRVSLGTTLATNLGANALNDVAPYCPGSWNVPLLAGATDYSVRSTLGNLRIPDGGSTFSPTKLGEDQLVIELNSSRFPLNASGSFLINTRPVQLMLDRSVIEVRDLGEEVAIAISFENSDTEVATWTTGAGSFVNPDPRTKGEVTRVLITPVELQSYPFPVVAEGAFETGLYAEAAPPPQPRWEVEVRAAEIIIEPADATVAKGGTVQYTAQDRAGADVEVRWETTGGSITSEGLFTAGDDTGEFSVSASLIDQPEIAASVPVTVIEPECVGRWSLRVAPWMAQITDQFAELSGTGASMQFVGGEYLLTVFEDGSFDAQRAGLTFAIVAPDFGSLEMMIDSRESGTVVFIPDESQSTSTVRVGSATVTETFSNATVRFFGVEQNVSTPSGFAGAVAYSCDETTFTVTADGVTATWDYLGPA